VGLGIKVATYIVSGLLPKTKRFWGEERGFYVLGVELGNVYVID
jgi:hypothetical protein